MEVLLGKVEKLVPARYSYSDVERITSSFGHKLGQGGFGVVYKGKLPDGRPVAVKVMKDCKGSVKDFFTEVTAIGCTYHVNIVSLLGFCSEGPKQVLIYQFMSNGSLEKYIHDGRQATSTLDVTKLLRIAIGVARGLEYLHHGCNVGILHFDIKPQNILLDDEFCPKIADFGLAKLCRSAEGIIKMLGARGTVGYIAPEVFSRCYGGVSTKSDVYSYGMMILEMVGGRKKCTAQEEERTSEIYLPHWVCKHLDSDGNLRQFRAMTEVEEERARRMVLVGLWCIQTRPSDRPSMTKVLDMLEGRITELQIPPMPVLSSPPASTMHSLAAQSQKLASVVTC
ncbi:receptor-like protein kinase [Musa troglodytarum]|uniref:Receptor-like protein kinase n=1 Tax=Musa troglodytarum TaxID=320322 RepID=A0A9E7JC48_9LILI|nr:receptor-like protein kinase [Musa troglodytarum]